MIVDVVSGKISLSTLPEEHRVIYTIEPHEQAKRDYLIVLMNSLLTFEIVSKEQFSTSLLDLFILKDMLKASNNFNVTLNITEKCFGVCKQYLLDRYEVMDIKDGKLNTSIQLAIKSTPYEDQLSGIAFMLKRERAINSCSVGIGKTLTALACFDNLYHSHKIDKGIIYCLNENKLTWTKEIQKHSDYKFKVVGNGSKIVLKDIEAFNEDLLVVHYDSLLSQDIINAIIARGFNFCIYDEAHIFRNLKTQRSKAVFGIVEITDPKYRYLLTGTPIAQCPLEAYSAIKLVRPTILPSHTRFKNHFCVEILIKIKNSSRKIPKIVKYKNLEQLKYIMDLYSFRKTHEDVKGFPPTVYSIKELELSGEQRQLYEAIREETFREIAEMPDKAMNLDHLLTKILRLRQCLSHPAILGEKSESVKFKYLDELLEEILSETDQKVVIWSTFRDTLELLHQKYEDKYGAVLFYGDMKTEERDKNVEKFTTPGGKTRMLLGITSLGTGGNFQVARTAIYIDEPLKILELKQSRGRITRRNAVGTSHIISLTCQNTIEDRWIRGFLESKEAIIDQVIDPDSNIIVAKNDLLKGLSKA